jgi:hypothetical protein
LQEKKTICANTILTVAEFLDQLAFQRKDFLSVVYENKIISRALVFGKGEPSQD